MSSEQLDRGLNEPRTGHDFTPVEPLHRATREQVHLRNYDPAVSYDLDVRLRRDDRCAIDRQIYLNPGEIRFLDNLVHPGDWQVIVSLAGKPPTRKRCAIGSSIARTACIQCSNGLLALNNRGSIA